MISVLEFCVRHGKAENKRKTVKRKFVGDLATVGSSNPTHTCPSVLSSLN